MNLYWERAWRFPLLLNEEDEVLLIDYGPDSEVALVDGCLPKDDFILETENRLKEY